ncbi:MAG: tRNA uridine-5-carboxymethylaminomethyl(34) synthesis enzyme MnmG [Bacteroidales bacterium]|nr:tRNA uridine-5-carboxymethylaminomethyl(34) synthesis enzyme MnmG [Bacteroidales bacterium]
MILKYDVVVVGGGHAGCEAAAAAAIMGAKTLLITMDMTKFAQMSCNPAMGGIAKGQIIREIDALGGYSGIVSDLTTIQFRMLNRSKGPAMWSPRAQCDRIQFSLKWREYLETLPNLDLWQDTVVSLIINNNSVEGVITKLGVKISAKTVVLTNGTFINGIIHVGKTTSEGGRISEPSSKGISEQLAECGFEVGRMKTGTPARIDGRSVDFSLLEPQYGEENGGKFSFLPHVKNNPVLMPCFITYTNTEVHRILERGFKESPLYTGRIKGIGPRYCPSIEDKIVTFASKDSHQLFLEPEGVSTNEYYLNGFSSSLPWQIQYEALRKIKGLENVKIFRPGYAIEYDYYPPTQLKATLETKNVNNLYFAGQINGTTGYEEAAGQGLMAGINAVLRITGREPFVLLRNQAYIGVLIDDLITKGVDEPYRMFTSRAEYRTLLRQDDADSRLTPLSHQFHLASDERMRILDIKKNKTREIIETLKTKSVTPIEINEFLNENGTTPIKQSTKAFDILTRPQISIDKLLQSLNILFADDENPELLSEAIEEAEILIKYTGYIDRERVIADKLKRLETIKIHNEFDYRKLSSLSTEARQKLSRLKPESIGQASRISGITPSDINVLLVHLGR